MTLRHLPLPLILSAAMAAQAQTAPRPSLADVPYGPHPRQVLDLYKAGVDRPAPLVFFIHGGGWGALDKANAAKMLDIPRLLEAGISVAAINYRFVQQAMQAGVEPPVKWPLEDAARALQFIRSKAVEWNIDKERIGACGGSAGGCSSLWLALHDDMAQPASADPVARESTRLWCAAVVGAQTSLDPHAMREWIPNITYGGHAFGFRTSGRSREAEFQSFYDARDRILPFLRQYSPIEHASAGDPPLWLSYAQREEAVKGRPQKDPTHSALFGVMLEERLRPLGVEVIVTYPAKPAGSYRNPTDYFIERLKAARGRSFTGRARTEIRREQGRFQLYRGGAPYQIKGVVYAGNMGGRFPLKDIAARGANSIRSSGGAELLDEAQKLGLSVLVNLPMRKESVDQFDYDDAKAVSEQFERIKERILLLKDHPAVLMWAIGNELSVRYTNRNVWNAVNEVARYLHQVDPDHPTMTVIGDGSINRGDIVEIRRRAPDLDVLGVNYYKDVETVPAKIRRYGWDKPYVLTEWGPSGDWQVPRTEWKASIEESSTEKARRYLERYQSVVLKDAGRCLGSYAFIWGARHERTQTWYGMHLPTGERTEAVNVMQYLWTGAWPANRAPRIEDLRIDGRGAADNVYLAPGTIHRAVVRAGDPDKDPLAFRWEILAEVARAGYAGRGEIRSKPMPELLRKETGGELTFQAPAPGGAYRVFVFITDGKGNGACANIPFFVRP